jgi:urease accessory protein
MRHVLRAAALIALAMVPGWASAHSAEAIAGFLSGFLHPVFGLDHFLAMLSVGVVSAQLGGARIFVVPATFVSAMIAGGVVGLQGTQWPLTEAGIALSVVVLGLAVVIAREGAQAGIVMVITFFFGCLHGHAHGIEIPRAADPVFYAGGFVLSTSAIHLLGVLVGHVLTRTDLRKRYLRWLGTGMSGIGLLIFVRLVAAGQAG